MGFRHRQTRPWQRAASWSVGFWICSDCGSGWPCALGKPQNSSLVHPLRVVWCCPKILGFSQFSRCFHVVFLGFHMVENPKFDGWSSYSAIGIQVSSENIEHLRVWCLTMIIFPLEILNTYAIGCWMLCVQAHLRDTFGQRTYTFNRNPTYTWLVECLGKNCKHKRIDVQSPLYHCPNFRRRFCAALWGLPYRLWPVTVKQQWMLDRIHSWVEGPRLSPWRCTWRCRWAFHGGSCCLVLRFWSP